MHITFDVPAEANKWLRNNNTAKGTRKDWCMVVDRLFTAFLEDISHDYELAESALEMMRHEK